MPKDKRLGQSNPKGFKNVHRKPWLSICEQATIRAPDSMRRVAVLLLAPAVVVIAIALLLPAVPQPFAYHNFADHRGWLGIPNFGDVVSNVPFAVVGAWGLLVLFAPGKAQF